MPNTKNKTEKLVSLKGVTKQFANGTIALNGLDLTINRGDFLSLLGPSGCGKSTVLRLLAGLDKVTSGAISWNDETARANLSMVFQDATLLPWASVERNIWMPLRLRGISLDDASEKIARALTLVGLSDQAQSKPNELSGGMKMRVSLARALVTEPEILLLDEPFAALDEINRYRLNDELLALREHLNCTVVFVTHSVFESAYLANRVAIMGAHSGQVENEINIDTPYPRTEKFRTTIAYSETCARISAALAQSA